MKLHWNLIGTVTTLRGQALAKEKRLDYRNIVIIQVLIICAALLIKETFMLYGVENLIAIMVRDTIFLLLAAIYLFVLYDHLRNLTQSKFLIYAVFIMLLLAYGFSIVVVNPFYKFIPLESDQRPYLFLIHILFFIVEITLILHCLFDIFSGKRMSEEKLWGSACIFFMIGLSFGSLYDLINISKPGAMGLDLTLGLDSYIYCIFYSMTIIGGHDATVEALPIIQNIGIIEAVWSNLFVVILVGRLLGQPDEQPTDHPTNKD